MPLFTYRAPFSPDVEHAAKGRTRLKSKRPANVGKGHVSRGDFSGNRTGTSILSLGFGRDLNFAPGTKDCTPACFAWIAFINAVANDFFPLRPVPIEDGHPALSQGTEPAIHKVIQDRGMDLMMLPTPRPRASAAIVIRLGNSECAARCKRVCMDGNSVLEHAFTQRFDYMETVQAPGYADAR